MLEALNKAIQKKFSKTDDNIIYDMKKRFQKMNIEFVSGSLKELVDRTHLAL